MKLPSNARLALPALLAGCLATTCAEAAPAAPVTVAPDPNALHVIAMARAATGGNAWEAVKGLHLTGKRDADSHSGTEETWVDTVQGRLAMDWIDENGAERLGVDGKTAWIEAEDEPARLAGDRERQDLVTEAYWRSDGWGRAASAGLSAVPLKGESHGGREYDIIRITPAGGSALDVWFDRASHLPAKLVTTTEGGEETIHLSEWRRVHDITLPWHIAVDRAAAPGAAAGRIEETITDVTPVRAVDATRYAPPSLPALDYTFPAGASSVETPISIVGDHVFLNGRIGKKRLHLRLDSASASAIDPRSAQTPDPTDGTAAVRLPEISIAGVVFRHQLVRLENLSAEAADEGVDVDGLIGGKFLSHLVVELDYAGRRLVLVRPDSFVPPPEAVSIPINVAADGTTVIGRIDGISATLTIDTASNAGLIVNPAFVESHDLRMRWHLAPAVADMDGTAMAAEIGHAGSLELGVLGIAQPVVLIPRSPAGRADGSIGNAVLRHFDVIFDYPHARLLLQEIPGAHPADAVDHAGLLLSSADGVLLVTSVVKDGPGAHAGLRTGDRIRKVDGEAVTATSLPSIRSLLRGPPGGGMTVDIDRHGTTVQARIVLADPLASPPGAP